MQALESRDTYRHVYLPTGYNGCPQATTVNLVCQSDPWRLDDSGESVSRPVAQSREDAPGLVDLAKRLGEVFFSVLSISISLIIPEQHNVSKELSTATNGLEETSASYRLTAYDFEFHPAHFLWQGASIILPH